jgi:hypothetical protein
MHDTRELLLVEGARYCRAASSAALVTEEDLFLRAPAPVSQLPARKIVGARHLIADLTLSMGEVAFDYLARQAERCSDFPFLPATTPGATLTWQPTSQQQ